MKSVKNLNLLFVVFIAWYNFVERISICW